MKSRSRNYALNSVLMLSFLFFAVQCSNKSAEHDHAASPDTEHNHEGHAHNTPDHVVGHEPETVKISKAQADRFGIKVAEVTRGTVNRTLKVPGEVKLNEEQAAHIVAQLSGIVKKSHVKVGDTVRAGQVLAVLESRELAEARAQFLAADKREQLAKDVFTREERLWKKQITSEQEYLAARQELAERRIEKNSARQQLLALGIPKNSIDNISASTDVSLSRFALRSPIDGAVLKKHLTLGESVQSGMDVFLIANLSTVWLDLSVDNKGLPELRSGLPVAIEMTGTEPVTTEISFVSPVVDHNTRTALVRAVVNNSSGILRPGLFVQATIQLPSEKSALLVPKGTIQTVHDHPTVFVWQNGVFALREVVPGSADLKNTEILKGVQAGELVAAVNAFHLKAEFIKAAAGDIGAHEGCSH